MVLTESQQAQIILMKRTAPFRIAYGVIDKDTGAFSVHSSFDMRIPNRLVREGHRVLVANFD